MQFIDRRNLLKSAAAAIAALILPRSLRVKENDTSR
jgi:hypothetical protein